MNELHSPLQVASTSSLVGSVSGEACGHERENKHALLILCAAAFSTSKADELDA